MRLKPRGTILKHTLILRNVVDRLLFWVRPVVIGPVIYGVNRFKYKGLDFFLCILVRERSSKWLLCPSKKNIWLLTGEAPHMLENWVTTLSHQYLSMHPDGVWWTFQSNGTLWWISREYSLAWWTTTVGMKHLPPALENTSKVQHNGARYPIFTFHIIYPWKKL